MNVKDDAERSPDEHSAHALSLLDLTPTWMPPTRIGAEDRDRDVLHEPLRLSRSALAWDWIKTPGRGATLRAWFESLTRPKAII